MHHLTASSKTTRVKAGISSPQGKPFWIIMMQLAKDDRVVLTGTYANKPLHLTHSRQVIILTSHHPFFTGHDAPDAQPTVSKN